MISVKMVKMKCWRRSRTTSGYYRKDPKNQGHAFINFRRNNDGSYNVEKRVGLGHPKNFRTIAKASNNTMARKKANKYMKKHDTC